MIPLPEYVRGLRNFDNLTHAAKILAFAWYLQREAKKETFAAQDVARCFSDSKTAPPTSIAPFLNSMVNRKNPVLLRGKGGYTLEKRQLAALDRKYGQRESSITVHRLLAELPSMIVLKAERDYLEETFTCFRNGAFRASIVMAWNLAYSHLCNLVVARELPAFNKQLYATFPKEKLVIVKLDDFQELKESQVLQVCRSAGIISVSLHKVMKEKLDRRNIAAHPSGIGVTQLTAEEFIRDLVENVVLKL